MNLKRVCLVVAGVLLLLPSMAQMPERTPENIEKCLVFKGLLHYGYTEEARELAEKTILLLGRDYERFGALHEYYLPDNGEPVLNKGFQNWNLLVLNMAAWLDGKETVSEFECTAFRI